MSKSARFCARISLPIAVSDQVYEFLIEIVKSHPDLCVYQTHSCKGFRRIMQSHSRRQAVKLLAAASLIPLATSASAEQTFSIVALGDSLTAGYGLAPEDAFTTRLEQRLKANGLNVEVVNAGVSGDTSKGGLARIDWSVPDGSGLVIVELGGNDALRGISPAETAKNLDAIIVRLRQRGIAILLTGMLAPPNMGKVYGAEFNAIYPKLAEKHDVQLYPFFLDGVVADPKLNQADGIHPNAAGTAVIVERLSPMVDKLVRSLVS
jgi:acyl-CoA thioesterase-1